MKQRSGATRLRILSLTETAPKINTKPKDRCDTAVFLRINGGISMFDYDRLRAACYKYKYETALETADRRISYKELLQMTDAVYNSLCVMNLKNSCVAVLHRACPEAVCAYFACARAGIECISADSRISDAAADALAEKYNPSAVIMPSNELIRLGKIFSQHGCKTAVLTGETVPVQMFPAQFGFSALLEKNDYILSDAKSENKPGRHVFYDGAYNDEPPRELFELPARTCVYISLPVFESSGALALTELLYSGGRCFLSFSRDAKLFRRKKVFAVVCDELTEPLYSESFRFVCAVKTDPQKPYVCAGGGILCPDAVGHALTETMGFPVRCEYDGRKIRIVAETNEDPDPNGKFVRRLSARAHALLYPNDIPKSLIFVKND